MIKETHRRDFDVLITHATIVLMYYMFQAYQYRIDSRTLDNVFHAHYNELGDISFVAVLYRILPPLADCLCKMDPFREKRHIPFPIHFWKQRETTSICQKTNYLFMKS